MLLEKNLFYIIIGLYFVFSVVLSAFFQIDITINCLWRTIFGFKCPGCGLTNACIELVKLRFHKAFECNPLVFIVIPGLVWYGFSEIRNSFKEIK